MIILDTNIISEMMKTVPSVKVISWLNKQQVEGLYVTTITIAEILYGINVLPEGKRRLLLTNAFQKSIAEAFQHRILMFDETAAQSYGEVMSNRKKIGKPLSILDGQIAAIAITHKGAIATRNIRDFSDCNLDLINPFE